ncbi:MAG: hypothetical protein ACRDS1_11565 [Pseudonocardiaceae bacterium]
MVQGSRPELLTGPVHGRHRPGTGSACVYLPASGIEPAYVLNPEFVTSLALRRAQRGKHAGLPVRLPGAHLHPQLRRPPVVGRCRGEAVSSA